MEESIVKVKHLSHRYSVQWAIKDINFEIKNKGTLGLLGSNGAGKSTLIRHLTGIYRPDCGSILIDGLPVYDNPEAKAKFTYIPDDLFYFLQADTLEMNRTVYLHWKKFRRQLH